MSGIYDLPITSKWDPPMWVPHRWVPLACERQVIYAGHTKYLLLFESELGHCPLERELRDWTLIWNKS
jgi:hypothetical protein